MIQYGLTLQTYLNINRQEYLYISRYMSHIMGYGLPLFVRSSQFISRYVLIEELNFYAISPVVVRIMVTTVI